MKYKQKIDIAKRVKETRQTSNPEVTNQKDSLEDISAMSTTKLINKYNFGLGMALSMKSANDGSYELELYNHKVPQIKAELRRRFERGLKVLSVYENCTDGSYGMACDHHKIAALAEALGEEL